MGCVNTISYHNFPRQKDSSYKYPQIGKRVEVCYHYDTSKKHFGTIVRADIEEPFETIIALDNGRFVRAVECQFSFIEEPNDVTNKTLETRCERIREVDAAINKLHVELRSLYLDGLTESQRNNLFDMVMSDGDSHWSYL